MKDNIPKMHSLFPVEISLRKITFIKCKLTLYSLKKSFCERYHSKNAPLLIFFFFVIPSSRYEVLFWGLYVPTSHTGYVHLNEPISVRNVGTFKRTILCNRPLNILIRSSSNLPGIQNQEWYDSHCETCLIAYDGPDIESMCSMEEEDDDGCAEGDAASQSFFRQFLCAANSSSPSSFSSSSSSSCGDERSLKGKEAARH